MPAQRSGQAWWQTKPDGYTILLATTTTLAANPSLYTGLSYKVDSFQPVTLVAQIPFVLVVNAGLGVTSLDQFIQLAKSSSLVFASVGIGTPPHLDAELLMRLAGFHARNAIYKGSLQGLSDVAAGEVSFMFVDPAATKTFIQQGKIKILGVTSSERFKLLQDIPTLREQGISSYEATSWMGIVVPNGTPSSIVEKLNNVITSFSENLEAVETLANLGIAVTLKPPSEFGTFIAAERKKWAQVIVDAGIEPQ